MNFTKGLLSMTVLIMFFCISLVFAESKKEVDAIHDLHLQLEKVHASIYANPDKTVATNKLVVALKGVKDKKYAKDLKKASLVAKKLGNAKDQKTRFETYSRLSEILEKYIKANASSGMNVFYCPMVKKKWIAKGEKVRNPYDSSMRECGNKL